MTCTAVKISFFILIIITSIIDIDVNAYLTQTQLHCKYLTFIRLFSNIRLLLKIASYGS